MAKTTKQLSDTEIRRAKPRAKEYNLADGKGLYLRIKPIGSKLWLFNYTRPITKNAPTLALVSTLTSPWLAQEPKHKSFAISWLKVPTLRNIDRV